MSLHELAALGKSSEIAALKPQAHDFLLRNHLQQTPLGVAICGNHIKTVEVLLDAGAAASIFVSGYATGSLVCTLPQTAQPPSSVFTHPPPLLGSSPECLAKLDDHLCDHIKTLAALKVAKAAAAAAALAQAQATKDPSDPGGAGGGATGKTAPPFNPFPLHLQVRFINFSIIRKSLTLF